MKTLNFPFRPLGLLLTGLYLLATLNLQAQTIPNASFEAQNFSNSPGYASGNGGSITGWSTNATSRVGLNTVAGPFVAATPPVPSGSWAAFIQSDGGANTLSTTITGLTSGVNYQVSFAAGQRTSYATPAPTLSLDGGSAVSFAVAEGSYTTITGTFTATGPTADLVVVNQTASDSTLVVDDFQITALGPTVTASTANLASNATSLTITGTGFDTTPGNNTVAFTPSGTGTVTGATATSLTVTSLSGLTAGTLNAVVTTNGQDSGSAVQVATVTGPVITYAAATDVPITAAGYSASGTLSITLNYAPTEGTNLTVINNTGTGFISGTFSNVANGATVNLTYGGTTYSFVAWYYGGTGNDLVLLWPYTGLAAWGNNGEGQLGDNSTTQRNVPVGVLQSGVLAGKTIVQMASSANSTMALCSDGTVASWGYNSNGQLGDNSTTQRLAPVAVDLSGVLSGKTVVAIATADYHSMALCSDGTVASWGWNASGQLGDNTQTESHVPVAVNVASGTSVLFGKTVVAIVASGTRSMALCSDGTVAAWGNNQYGQLGDNSTTLRLAPVAVNVASGTSALFGKTVVAITAGNIHSLAICSDGTAAAWGNNANGQLGDNSTTLRQVPVAVDTSAVLAGKTVVSLAGGVSHSVALCSDGTVASWGIDNYGQLGDNSTTQSQVPVAVNVASGTSALFGKTVVKVTAGNYHSLALCSDGTLAAWGFNGQGQIGDNSSLQRNAPVAVNVAAGTSVLAGRQASGLSRGISGNRSFAIYGLAPPPTVPANLVAQWVADDWAGGITDWVDRIGGKIATVPGASNSPTKSATGLDGMTALVFDGVDDYLQVSAAQNPIVGKNSVTIVAYFNATQGASGTDIAFWRYPGPLNAEGPGAPNDWGLTYDAAGDAQGFFNNPVDETATVNLLGGQPHTMIMTWKDQTDFPGEGVARLYVDGELIGSTSPFDGGAGIYNNGFVIGSEPEELLRYFTGAIRELRFYDDVIDPMAIDAELVPLRTLAATSVTSTTGTLNGRANPQGAAMTAWFEYGTDPTLAGAASTTVQDLGSGSSPVSFNQALTGIGGNTKYYFRVVASAGGATAYGSILSFVTGPDIALEQPAGTDLTDGVSTVSFGNVPAGIESAAKIFTIKNKGGLDLTDINVVIDGAFAGDYLASAPGVTTLPPGASTTFSITFTPGAVGARPAALHIASNDSDENPFDLALDGTAPPTTIWTGPPITFTKDNYDDWNQEENQDRLTPAVWLTRQNNQGIYNIATEGSYDFSSPADTEWAYGTTADLGSLSFSSWRDWYNRDPFTMTTQDAVLHLISENIYIDIKFSFWQDNANGGGFSYTRSTPAVGVEITSPTSASITATSATLGGDVTSDGGDAITERGVVYSITTTNADPLIDGTGVMKVTASGTTGVFTAAVSNLTPGAGYSFKAYATNSAGTSYTAVSTFLALSTIDTSSGSPQTIAAIIAGVSAITKTGTDVLTLSGLNTYSGSTDVQAGTLSINTVNTGTNAQALGEGSVVNLGVAGASSGTLLYTGGAGTLDKTINALGNGSDTVENGGSGLLTLSGTLNKAGTVLTLKGGANGITVSGSITGNTGSPDSDLIVDGGVVTLTNANTYNGPTYIRNSGTLNADAIDALPTLNGRTDVTFDGTGTSVLSLGTAQSVASLTSAGAATVTLNANTLTLGAASGSTTFAGIIGGTGGLIKDGASTQILTGANSYTGTTTISAGTLQLTQANATSGFILDAGVLQFNFAAANYSMAGDLTFNGDATVGNLGQQVNLTGTVNGNNHVLTIDNGASTNTMYFNGAFGSALSQVNIVNGVVGEDGNTGTPLRNAAVVISSGAAFATYNAITVNNNFTLNGGAGSNGNGVLQNQGAGTATYSGTINLNSGNSSIGTGGGNIGITNVVSGSGSLTKIGANTLTLSGANTFTGTTTVSAGTLKAGVASVANVSGAFGKNSAIAMANVAGATLDITGFNTQVGSLTGGGSTGGGVTLGAATLTVGGDNTSPAAYAGAISGTGGLTKIGTGTQIFSGASDFTGAVTVNGGVIKIGSTTALGTYDTSFGKVTVASGAAVDFNGQVDAVYGYTIAGTGIGGTGALVNTGAAITNGFRQASNIRLAAAATIGGTADWALLTTAYGATNLDLAGFTLTKVGANTIYLANTTVTAGNIAVNAGTLATTAAASNASAASLTLANTAGVSLSLGADLSVGSLAGGGTTGGTVALGSATLTVGGLGTSTAYAGVISGSGALAKVGSGTLTLSAINTYTGATTISTGVINIQNASALGTVAAGTSVTSGATLQIQGGITTLAEALTLNGAGVSSAGALRNISGTNDYAGLVTLGSATRINSDAGTLTLSNTGTITGAFGLTVGGAGNTTINSIIGTTAGGLTKDGAGTLTLTGANTYSGGNTSVTGGTLRAGASNVLSGSVAVAFAGTLDLNGFNAAVSGNTIGTSSLYFGANSIGQTATVTTGAGVLTVNGNIGVDSNAYGTNLLSGNLDLGGSVRTISVITGGTGVTLTISAAVANGGITKTQGGTLILSGSNGYSGATTVSAGTLSITGDINSSATIAVNSGLLSTSGASKLADAAAVTVAGGTLTLGGNDTVGTLTMSGSGSTIGGSSTLTATTYALGGGSTVVNGNLGTGTINSSGTVALKGTAGATVVNVTAGALTLGASSAINSATTVAISGGSLTLGASNQINDSATVTLSGGTLAMGANADTVGALVLTSGSITGSTGVLTSTATYDMQAGSVSAILGGSAGLTKTGAGTVTLSGVNTYTGATTVSTGTLQVSGSLAAGSTVGVGTAGTLSGTGTINGNTTLTGSGIINLSSGTLAGTLGVTGGNWNGTGSVTGLVTSSSGTFTIGNGANLTANGELNVTGGTLASGNSASTITGSVNYTSGSNSSFGGVIAGSGRTLLLNNAAATLTLGGANTYTGATTITAGILNIQNATGLGTIAAGTSVSNGATLQLQGGITVGAETLSLNGGAAAGQTGALVNVSGTNTYGGAITIASSSSISAASGSVLNLTGGLVKNGTTLTLNGGGTINVSAVGISGAAANSDLIVDGTVVNVNVASTYNGPTFIRNSGTLNANVANALPTANGRTAVTFDGTGTSVLTLGANQSAASLTAAGAATVTLNANTLTLGAASGSTTYAGTIGGTGGLFKDGASTQILSGLSATAGSNYSGTTIIDSGTLGLSSASTVAFTGGLTFGSTSATTTTGTLDLTNASATFGGAMLVQTNSASANTITIGAGKTLTTNGNVTIGAAGTGSADQLTVSGSSGAWVVGGGTTFSVGGSTSTAAATSTLDMSGLGTFTAGTVGTPLTLFKIGSTDSNTITDVNSVLLATTATITATTMDIGASTSHNGVQTLSIGTGSGASLTTFNTNTLSIGATSGKGSGVVNFADGSLGEIKIRAANGSGAAVLDIVNSTTSSGVGFNGSLLLAGHAADILVSTLTVASRSATGSWTNSNNTGTLTFDSGTFNASTVVLSSRGGASVILANTVANATFGGGTVTLGTVTMSTNSATTNTTTGSANSTLTFNGSGTNSITTLNMGSSTVTGTGATGVVTNGTLDLSGTAVTTIGTLNMAVNSSTAGAGANTAQSTINLSAGTLNVTGNISMGDGTVNGKHSYNNAINLTGGTLTVDGNITRSATVAASTGTYTSTITLNGGTLDMTNGSIGGANAITLNAMSGTLQNLSQLNAGGALTKTGTGTLIMAGTNSYTGATTITTGTLQVSGSLAAGSTVGVGTAGTLSGAGTINGNATLTGGGIINLTNPGIIAGTLGVTGGNWNGAGSVTGAVTSSSGAFTIGSGANLTANGGLNVTGGTLVSGSATSTITGSVNYTSASNSSFGGVIAGSGKTVTMNNAAATLTLGGTSTYTGATTLSAGSLTINGSIGSSSLLTINGGSLLGTGTVGAVQLNSGGVINAGAVLGAGALTTGNIAITDGQLVFNLGAAGAHNQINTNGTLNLANGGSGAQLVLNSISGYTATLGNSFTLVSNDLADAITGAFAKGTFGGTKVVTLSGVDYVEGLLGSSYYGKISYDGGTGNDLTLTVVTPVITITESGSNVAHASTYDFGALDKVTPEQTLTKTFTIKNDGGVDLLGISVNAPTGAAAADYIVDTAGTASALAPGASTTFTITFSPGALGTRAAAITIDSNDLTKNPFNLALTGVGDVARDLNLAWVQSYGSPTAPGTRRNGDARSLAVYKVGGVELAVCATGYTTNAAGNKDIYTACYDPADGTLLWEKLLDGVSGGADEGNAIAVDASGNVIVTGYTTNAAGSTDVITAKYAQADGTLMWQKIYNGTGNSYDVALSVAVDASGNVAVGGYGVNASGGMDVFAARYSADGSTTYFETLVDGGGNGTDQALAVDTDSAGNVLLTGFRTQSGAGKDFLVLKLNATTGVTTWSKIVNGSSSTDDLGYALVVDGSDAVVVTGSVRGVNYDLYTLKLSSAGAELWSKQWNSAYDSSEAGYAVALDSLGHVIVTGGSYTTAGTLDGYVAKYNGSTGALLWDYRYAGADLLHDSLGAVALDGADNVIATGYTQKTGGSYDVVTLKLLSGDGGLLWTQLYDGAANLNDSGRALAVTTNGQAFVAGYSGTATSTDFLVFSYAPQVPATQAAQTITFANPGVQSADTPLTLAATSTSGLAVHFAVVSGLAEIDDSSSTQLNFTGSGSVTVRATQSGSSTYAAAAAVDQTFTVNKAAQTISFILPAVLSSTAQWPLTGVASSGLAVTYSVESGPGTIAGGILSFSGAGDVTVRASQVGDGRYNAAVNVDAVVTAQNRAPIIIFDSIMENWRDTYVGSGDGAGNDIALQLSGNDAIAGFVTGYTTGTDKDLYLVKYLADGTLLWSVTSGATGNDEGMSLLVDANGDVVVAGYITGGNGQDVFVAKYNGGTGVQMWSYTYNGPGNGNDVGVSLGLDGTTNVVVGGYVVGSGTSYDFFAAKLNLTTGAVVWASVQNRSGASADIPTRVAVGTDGSVALTGATNSDAWTIKLAAASGVRTWQVGYNYANKPDAARGLALDAANNVIISAYSQGTNYDMYTAKYASLDGTLIWGKRYNSSFNSSDHPWDLAVDEDSNVYVTGASYRSAGVRDGMTLKYAGLDGALIWEGRFNGASSANDENASISLDGIGNPVISGYTTNADGSTDVYLAKHDKVPGSIRWQNTFDGANNKNDSINKVRVDPNGNVWMAGSATTVAGQKQVLVLRDIPTP